MFPNFKDLMHFLLTFRQISWILIILRVNKEKIGCPVVFEEINAMFRKKMSETDTEIDKNPKIFQFQSVYAFFVRFSTGFVDSNVLMVQQGKFGCPVVFCEEFIAVFQKKMSQNDTKKRQKFRNFKFSKFSCIFPNF